MAAKKKGGAGAGRTGEILPGGGSPLRQTVVHPSGSRSVTPTTGSSIT